MRLNVFALPCCQSESAPHPVHASAAGGGGPLGSSTSSSLALGLDVLVDGLGHKGDLALPASAVAKVGGKQGEGRGRQQGGNPEQLDPEI